MVSRSRSRSPVDQPLFDILVSSEVLAALMPKINDIRQEAGCSAISLKEPSEGIGMISLTSHSPHQFLAALDKVRLMQIIHEIHQLSLPLDQLKVVYALSPTKARTVTGPNARKLSRIEAITNTSITCGERGEEPNDRVVRIAGAPPDVLEATDRVVKVVQERVKEPPAPFRILVPEELKGVRNSMEYYAQVAVSLSREELCKEHVAVMSIH